MRIHEQKDANSRRSGLLALTTDASLPRRIRIAKMEHLDSSLYAFS